MAARRSADWRFPAEMQERAETRARRMLQATLSKSPTEQHQAVTPAVGPADPMPDVYWDTVLADPRAVAGARSQPAPRMALRDIQQHVLRVECLKCFAIIEIQTVDAMRLYGGGSTWKEVGQALLEGGCLSRTGNRDSDGCSPDYRN